ncbi:MAG: glycerophosphodiester phosphodiesterase [Gammaproteobacteria bacterium]|nr:glycerophosphodiester phosphodiesterase [Gammaproteobacteria bacterium]MBU1447344.1 glycerophosphodiester phosphodiesterase [Gammaproteobacteria bacterium]MDD2928351.1 glycerophosphodiester phosphodiesterase [Sideroxydans sp.]MDD5470481.1 glycerophosphodiester phosphodiesterase [Sideroxydans sp.]
MSKTLIYAHRGANREAAENTHTAFDRALLYPIDGIETDVQLSRDEVAVLWHDRDLKKLGLPGKRIDEYDYQQLQEMNFAAHFPDAKPEGVMSLQAFVDAYLARCRLLLEIKNRSWEEAARQTLKVRQTLVLAGDAGDGVLVSSFNMYSLVYAHGIAPDFPLVLNLEPEHTVNDARRALDEHPFLHGLCVEISTLDVDMVGLLRERGKSVAVYTCNTEAEIERALVLGVDILISDVPRKALRMRDK